MLKELSRSHFAPRPLWGVSLLCVGNRQSHAMSDSQAKSVRKRKKQIDETASAKDVEELPTKGKMIRTKSFRAGQF